MVYNEFGESLNDSNPIKNVFIIAKRLLNTKKSDEDMFEAKLELGTFKK